MPLLLYAGSYPGDNLTVAAPGQPIRPHQVGCLGWSMPPEMAQTTGATPVSGAAYLAPVRPAASGRVSVIDVLIQAGAVTQTANQNFLGLYDDYGNLLGTTAAGAIDAGLVGTGVVSGTLTVAPMVGTGGLYYVALLQNATTPAKTFGGQGNSAAWLNLGNANPRWARTTSAALTTLPANIGAVQTSGIAFAAILR